MMLFLQAGETEMGRGYLSISLTRLLHFGMGHPGHRESHETQHSVKCPSNAVRQYGHSQRREKSCRLKSDISHSITQIKIAWRPFTKTYSE